MDMPKARLQINEGMTWRFDYPAAAWIIEFPNGERIEVFKDIDNEPTAQYVEPKEHFDPPRDNDLRIDLEITNEEFDTKYWYEESLK